MASRWELPLIPAPLLVVRAGVAVEQPTAEPEITRHAAGVVNGREDAFEPVAACVDQQVMMLVERADRDTAVHLRIEQVRVADGEPHARLARPPSRIAV